MTRNETLALAVALTLSALYALPASAQTTEPSVEAEGTSALPIAPPAVEEPPTPAEVPQPPEVEPEGVDEITDLFTQGKFSANLRFRYEFADSENADASNALTLRTRLGFATAPVAGVNGFIELEDVHALDDNLYNAAGLNGEPQRTVIADPQDTELNQLYAKWVVPSDVFGEDNDLVEGTTLIAGRQRIILDNARFVGNVGWRQNEQTFDAGVIDWKPAGLEKLDVFYAYVLEVNRIFGPDSGRDFDGDSHFLNASYTFDDVGKLSLFAYLLDFDNAAAFSSQTYGFLFTGDRPIDEDEGLSLAYAGSLAFQSDLGDNPNSYDALYANAEATLKKKDLGAVGLGYELLGNDDDAGVAFQTPLATLHAFNGFADVFLNTPGGGLQDFYASVGKTLPYEIDAKVIGHLFFDSADGDALGYEVDAVASKKINDHLTLLTKGAYFIGEESEGYSDIFRFWLQADLSF